MEIKDAGLKFNGTLTKRKSTTEIILHCAATREGKNFTVQQIHQMHLKNGWSGIGYNYYIDLDGVIWRGRPEDCTGAHTTNHNSKSIGICYCGGVAADGKTAKDTRNEKQKAAMLELLRYLHKKYPQATIHGHNEFAAKACPSFKVSEYLKTINLDEPVITQTATTAITGKCLCSLCKVENCKNRK